MTSDNSKSQIDFLDLKIIKIKIQALLLLRFNLRFEIWDFTLRQPSYRLYTFSSKLSTQVRQTNEFWVYLKKHKSLVFTAW